MDSSFGALNFPTLRVVDQQCLSTETLEKGDVTKKVHVVVKNSPFRVRLAIANADLGGSPLAATYERYLNDHGRLAISGLSFKCRLLYDTEEHKEVDYVRVQPFQFKVESVKKDAASVDIEVRLKVLSSQHEDLCFRVQFYGVDPQSHEALPNLECISAPIKVISKPEQLKERSSRKQTANERIVERLKRIRLEQDRHQHMLDALSGAPTQSLEHVPLSSSPITPHSPHGTATPAVGAHTPVKSEEPIDLREALHVMLRVYQDTPKGDRANIVKSALEASGAPRRAQILEVRDLFVAEGMPALHDEPAHDAAGLECNCPECPWRQELERIELFYKDVFSLGS